MLNAASNKGHACGSFFGHDVSLTLDDALRTGAIVRDMDIDETEAQEAERIAPNLRAAALRSGDQLLVNILKLLPDESWVRLRGFFQQSDSSDR